MRPLEVPAKWTSRSAHFAWGALLVFALCHWHGLGEFRALVIGIGFWVVWERIGEKLAGWRPLALDLASGAAGALAGLGLWRWLR